MTYQEDNITGLQPKRKKTSQEKYNKLKGGRPPKKMIPTSKGDKHKRRHT